MKKIIGKWITFITVIAMIFSIFAIAGCTPGHDYTVKVVGPDGLPYTTTVRVQPCKVEADGELGECYASFVPTDENGVAYLELGTDIPDTTVNEIEIHLFDVPSNLTYTPPRMHKGETVTIKLSEKDNTGDLKTPLSGTGEGSYSTDPLGNTRLSFDPYVVETGSYRLKFSSADQKIFYAFQADSEAVYKVYSTGGIDAAVTRIYGSEIGGYYPGGEEDGNDNVSATDKNFSYEFEVSPSLLEQNQGISYFEVSLKNAQDINKDAVICFEYVKEWEEEFKPETEDIEPAHTLEAFPDYNGEWVDADLDGEFVYVMGDDGYYHVGDKNGPILCASLGQDPSLNSKHTGSGNAPRGYDIGFTLQYAAGQSLTVSDGKTYTYNYYPLVEAYTKASNSDGRYGVTEELKNFLDAYINRIGGTKNWVEVMGKLGHLPDGEEWLWACGYYAE